MAGLDHFQRLNTGAPRGGNALDMLFTNVPQCIEEEWVLPPLEIMKGMWSNYKCIYLAAKLGRARNYRRVTRMRRSRNRDRELAFAADLRDWDWERLREANDVTNMAAILEQAIAKLTKRHFLLESVRNRSNEDPLVMRSIRRLASTAELLRNLKKTDSRVEGDLLSHLIRIFPEEFATPISEIYNRINDTGYWHMQWKTEHLTRNSPD